MRRLSAGLASSSDVHGREQRTEALLTLSTVSRETVAPLDRLLHDRHPWIALAIVPLCVWANAGILLGAESAREAIGSLLTWAIAIGLAFGNPVGLTVGWAIAIRAGAEPSGEAAWPSVLGIGMLACIAFTVALFVTESFLRRPSSADAGQGENLGRAGAGRARRLHAPTSYDSCANTGDILALRPDLSPCNLGDAAVLRPTKFRPGRSGACR